MMPNAPKIALLLALAALPLLEIGVLIYAGQAMGFWRLFLLIIVTAVLGVIILRRIGFAMLTRMMSASTPVEGRIASVFDGMLLATAAILLILPGLIADGIGLILLIPPVRKFIIASGFMRPMQVFTTSTSGATYRTYDADPSPTADSPRRSGRKGEPLTIEGEYERIDETPVQPGRDIRRNDN